MRFIDLSNKTFGRLTVIERAPNKGKYTMWKCVCNCPNKTICIVRGELLKRGETQSCGCLHKESLAKMATKHGMRHTKIYAVWVVMRDRCYNSNNKDYADYGGRGITVYPSWKDNIEPFYEYVSKLPHFEEKGYSLERIDNNRNYEPGNVKWADKYEQANNKRNNHLLEYKGKKQTLAMWAKEKGFAYSKLESRINRYHWSIDRALETP